MVLDEEPWSIAEAWLKICHEHDDMVRFMEESEGVDDDAFWMTRKWLPPPEGMVNLCVDGIFRVDPGCMGWGGVLRDSQGSWRLGFHGY